MAGAPIELTPIGAVESPLTDRASAPKQGDEGAPRRSWSSSRRWPRGCDGIRPGEELFVLTWLDRAEPRRAGVHPRGDPATPQHGVFSTRSAGRPNPIGLHLVTIAAIDGTGLACRDLEALHATPILDVKPALRPGAPR